MKPSILNLQEIGALWSAENSSSHCARCDVLRFGIPDLDSTLPSGGIPIGTIHEWSTETDIPPLSFFSLLAAAEVHRSGRNIVWIEDSVWPLPQYLFEISKSEAFLKKCFFVQAKSSKTKEWVLDQCARTKGVGLIIAELSGLSRNTLKKLSIAAKYSGATILFFKHKKDAFSSFSFTSKWNVSPLKSEERIPHFKLELNSYKGSGIGSVKWNIRFDSKNVCVLPERVGEVTLEKKYASL